MSKDDELVLCVPDVDLVGKEGFTRKDSEGFGEMADLIANEGLYLRRGDCETDPTYRQIIPYCVVRSNGMILRIFRKSAGNEARLHGKGSIGIGGHINPQMKMLTIHEAGYQLTRIPECYQDSQVVVGAINEIYEELDITGKYWLEYLGDIKLSDSPVSSVHYGMIFLVDLALDTSATIKETEKLEGEAVTPSQLRKEWDNLEEWSQLLVDNVIK